MAMFIALEEHDYGIDIPRQYEWHIGEKLRLVSDNVIAVQADGDELIAIEQVCGNIPRAAKPVVLWFGDHAKFIVANVVPRD